MGVSINDVVTVKRVERAYTHIEPVTIGAEPATLVPAPGERQVGMLVEVGLYNSDTETRTVTISDGESIFRKFYIPAGGTFEVWIDGMEYEAAENTAITATASAADVVEITGGRWTKRQVR